MKSFIETYIKILITIIGSSIHYNKHKRKSPKSFASLSEIIVISDPVSTRALMDRSLILK
jgi:hypothetical protein